MIFKNNRPRLSHSQLLPKVFYKIETTMELFLCVFIHVRVSDAFIQLSQLRGTGFAVGIYKGKLRPPFPVGDAQSSAHYKAFIVFLIHSVINTLDQF